MKKLITSIFFVPVLIFTTTVAFALTEVPLMANKNVDIGDVLVSNDNENLYIKYALTGDWCLTETHLHVATAPASIPQTKKGNPIPGHFAFKTSHDLCVNEYTYSIPMTWPVYLVWRTSLSPVLGRTNETNGRTNEGCP